MLHATFTAPSLTTFCRLDELGLEAVGQIVEPDRAVIECRVAEPDRWCRKCGCEGVARDTVARRLAHEPFGHRPTTLLIRVRRYKCSGCGRVWRQDTSKAAPERAKISRGGLAWGGPTLFFRTPDVAGPRGPARRCCHEHREREGAEAASEVHCPVSSRGCSDGDRLRSHHR